MREKCEFGALIKYYFSRGKTLSEAKIELDKYYLDSTPSYGIVQNWFTEFPCGRTCTETIPSPGRLNEITTPEKKHELGCESLPHPLYSPDLAPSDYYPFPNLKIWLCGRLLESNEEIKWKTKEYFGGFDKSSYLEGIQKLKDR